jgi:hypothetical protein
MGDSRREEFVKRLSTAGLGVRESIQIMLAGVVSDVREGAAHKKYAEEEIEVVIAFHDEAESLWQESIATNPPMEAAELTARLHKLLAQCVGPLGEFESKLRRGVEHAERFEQQAGG